MLALTAVLVIALLFIAAQPGNQGGLNIPVTGGRAETDQNPANSLPAGGTAQGEFKVFEPFARPEIWGLLAAVAGTLIFGLNLAVLSRQE
jgi:hypothetical protein